MCDHKTANLWTARIIPAVLIGIIGYASWVVTKLVAGSVTTQPLSEITN